MSLSHGGPCEDGGAALKRFTEEIRERVLGLEAWLARQPEAPYGLAMVSPDVVVDADLAGVPMFVIDDDEFRTRARALLPEQLRGGSVLVVAPIR